MSQYYDMEVENDTKRLAIYIEPLLTVVLGAAVLFFALAIFLPMWDMTKFAKTSPTIHKFDVEFTHSGLSNPAAAGRQQGH